ncbi:MAG: hypothetical protein WCG05_03715 [Alphaproteobacteria bacterium]
MKILSLGILLLFLCNQAGAAVADDPYAEKDCLHRVTLADDSYDGLDNPYDGLRNPYARLEGSYNGLEHYMGLADLSCEATDSDNPALQRIDPSLSRKPETLGVIQDYHNRWSQRKYGKLGPLVSIARIVYGTEPNELLKRRLELVAVSQNMISKFSAPIDPISEPKIPYRTHRIWLTGVGGAEAFEVKPEILQYYTHSLKLLPDWDHHFWCFDPTTIPETISALKKDCPSINIHSLTDSCLFTNTPKDLTGVRRLFDAYLEHRHFSFANDVLRRVIAWEFGGFYSDLGVEYHSPKNLRKCALYSNLVYFSYGNGDLDTCFFGISKGSPVFKRELNTLDYLLKGQLINEAEEVAYDKPIAATPAEAAATAEDQQASPQKILPKQMHWTSNAHGMAVLLSTLKKSDSPVIIPDRTWLTVHHQNSWRGKGDMKLAKFGQRGWEDLDFDFAQLMKEE